MKLGIGLTISNPSRVPGPVDYTGSTITVTGTLTSDGSTPVVVDSLNFAGYFENRPYWSNIGLSDYVSWDGSKWELISGASSWTSTDNTPTPDLATFSPVAPATGTPVLTLTFP